MSKVSSCCSCGSECCGPAPTKKKIEIDFLYLDLSTCGRCQGTETNLDEAIREVSSVLEAAGYEVTLNRIHIDTKELALKHQFVSSPTIRVNGRDIAMEFKESLCQDCGDLCGDTVECRVWISDGVEYNEPPKSMIVNAILKEVYSGSAAPQDKNEIYVLPENLARFFMGKEKSEA